MILKKFYLTFFLMFSFTLHGKSLSEKLSKIPERDLKKIEFFFHYSIYESPAPFTIFGNKPLSIIDCRTDYSPYYVVDASHYAALKEGFLTWEKYQSLFTLKNYKIFLNELPDQKTFSIFFLNRPSVLNVIKEHLTIFQDVMKEKISAEEILNKIENSTHFLAEVFHSNQRLIGLLLGFGDKNAKAFDQIHDKNIVVYKVSSFNSDPYNPLIHFRIPDFMSIPNDEDTASLRMSYENQRKKILKEIQHENFLEVTLRKLST